MTNRRKAEKCVERMRRDAVEEMVGKWNMKWLKGLAGIRGLSSFGFALFTLRFVSFRRAERFVEGPEVVEKALLEYLRERVCGS